MDLDMRVACAVRVGSGGWGKGADRAVRSASRGSQGLPPRCLGGRRASLGRGSRGNLLLLLTPEKVNEFGQLEKS
jgi:hypothetical protein